jgi:SAM-dependent methyltransferase
MSDVIRIRDRMDSPYSETSPPRYHEVPMSSLTRIAIAVVLAGLVQTPTPTVKPDVIFIGSEDHVVSAMLKLAHVTKTDVVYDLGCGDGRIVIAAARDFGARGVGIEIDPDLARTATAAAKAAKVSDRVTIITGNIFDPAIKISDATVVTLFLLQSLNEKLRPRLQSELRPGTRIVSNAWHMGSSWPPERTEDAGNSTIYLWTVGKSPLLQLRR